MPFRNLILRLTLFCPRKTQLILLPLFFPIHFFSFASTAEEHCPKTKTVLITGFVPFDGASENRSRLVVKYLKENQSPNDCLRYEVCLLPVKYGRAADTALSCMDNLSSKPDAVVSVGESQCRVRIESTAYNYFDADEEYSWKSITPQKIDSAPGVPLIERLNFPSSQVACATNSNEFKVLSPPSKLSFDMGSFVCNDTSFRLNRILKPQKIPFAFIHVPTMECPQSTESIVRKVHLLIKTGLSIINGSTDPIALPDGAKPITRECVYRHEKAIQEASEEIAAKRKLSQ